jgi:hypothetical protein
MYIVDTEFRYDVFVYICVLICCCNSFSLFTYAMKSVLVEKLTLTWLGKKFPAFMEPKSLLPYLQEHSFLS